ncbi:hypothetical protein LZ009_19235 [Ramlibacter sp. XY19]|uniref:hypothetical protein n=1 Tax=Ramlibacter paludis TaxID=2908000 RepID=UPI0023DC38E5|nr:hypothetical protein [Ramlibacter paludis]MCG2594918.1 hypothetical protein [Ramlibacter paludis]
MAASRHRLLDALWVSLGFMVAGNALALGESAPLRVSITLNGPQDQRCISLSLSEHTQAEVRVVCSTGQFVDIEPAAGKQFTGTHGSAYRYRLPMAANFGGSLLTPGDAYVGGGTITALRIYNVNGSDGPLEMLVSF